MVSIVPVSNQSEQNFSIGTTDHFNSAVWLETMNSSGFFIQLHLTKYLCPYDETQKLLTKYKFLQ